MKCFVFGSNYSGIHGAGAARHAFIHHGANWGQGIGLQGLSYAIPTKDENLETLPLDVIAGHVIDFIEFAAENTELTFMVTAIGCGLAGLKSEDIAPMFKTVSENVKLPTMFLDVIYPDGYDDDLISFNW